jgi:hypothetical protein
MRRAPGAGLAPAGQAEKRARVEFCPTSPLYSGAPPIPPDRAERTSPLWPNPPATAPAGNAPSEHAEMFKIIHKFATQTARTDGMALYAQLRHTPRYAARPYLLKTTVHNKTGYVVGVEFGDGRTHQRGGFYTSTDFAIEQFCGLVHQFTPADVLADHSPHRQPSPDLYRRACWNLCWRCANFPDAVGSIYGIATRTDSNNHKYIKRLLENKPMIVEMQPDGELKPLAKLKWSDYPNKWMTPAQTGLAFAQPAAALAAAIANPHPAAAAALAGALAQDSDDEDEPHDPDADSDDE